MNKLMTYILFALFSAAPGLASAAIDTTPATDLLGVDGTAAITAIGGAIIALAALAVVFKWVKGAIFS